MLLRSPKIYFLIFAFVMLHTGAIRKNYDAIVDTQTDAVSWKQLEEQLKDGEKAAPTPSFKFYANESFQFTPPVAGNRPMAGTSGEHPPSFNSALPEEVEDSEGDSSNENWWVESWQDPKVTEREAASDEFESFETTKIDSSSESLEKNDQPSQLWEENW